MKITKVLLAFIIPLIFVAFRYFTAPPLGFCESQNRILSNSEYIKASTEGRQSYQKIVEGKPSVIGCCSVERVEGNFLSKVFRIDEGVWVSWSYEMDEEGIKKLASPGERHYNISHLLDSCATTALQTTGITQK